MTFPAEQLALESQRVYRDYFGQFGTNPVTGDPFRDLAGLLRLLRSTVEGLRGDVAASRFSDTVIPEFLRATASDAGPLDNAIAAAYASARAVDDSVRTNIDGADAIAGISRREAAEIAAVPDPDSPAGQAAILAIIEKYQGQAAQTMTGAATAQQNAGQRAAAAAGPTGADSSGGFANIGQLLSSLLGSLTGGGGGTGSGDPLGSALGGLPLSSLLGPALGDPGELSPADQVAAAEQSAGSDASDAVVAGPVPATLASATSATSTGPGQPPVSSNSVSPVAQHTTGAGEDDHSQRGAPGRGLPSTPGTDPARSSRARLVSASANSGMPEAQPDDNADPTTESVAST